MKNQKVFVMGHKNPDTDSICSAIAYADIKNRTTQTKRYIPRRAGQINEETQYVLNRFGVQPPAYLGNIGTQVKDMDIRPVEGVSGKASEPEILSVLDKQGIRPGEVELWGTGKPLREFLWSEEMADASVYIMEHVDFEDVRQKEGEVRNTHINIGTGIELSIREVAELIRREIGFEGELRFNSSKPDGTLRKLTDVSKLHALGWRHTIEIEEGVKRLYEWYLGIEK